MVAAAKKKPCKMASILFQKWFFKNFFFSKTSKFCTFRTIRFGSNFASLWSKYVTIMYTEGDFKIPVSAFATVTRKGFNGKFTTKIEF